CGDPERDPHGAREQYELDRPDDRVRHPGAAAADGLGEERHRERARSLAGDVREDREQRREREDDGEARRDRRGARGDLASDVRRLELGRHDSSAARGRGARGARERLTSTRAATLKATVTVKRRSPISASAATWSS